MQRGEVAVLLGRNGAGKTTTLKTIIGLVPAERGEIRFIGRRIDGLPPYRIAASGLGYVPEDRRIFTDLTVAENLDVGRQPPRDGVPVWTLEKLFALFPNLAEMRNRAGGRTSGGEHDPEPVGMLRRILPYKGDDTQQDHPDRKGACVELEDFLDHPDTIPVF